MDRVNVPVKSPETGMPLSVEGIATLATGVGDGVGVKEGLGVREGVGVGVGDGESKGSVGNLGCC